MTAQDSGRFGPTRPGSLPRRSRRPATVHGRAWGCQVLLAVTEPESLLHAQALLGAELDAVDRAASRFRPDSEVAALAAAEGTARPITPLLADLIAVALDAARRTEGDLDPTLGADLVALGYDRDVARLPLAPPTARQGTLPGLVVRRPAGWGAVELDVDASTVRVPAGVVLDLGATAKARSADRSAARIAEALGCGVLVGLGGDIAVAGQAPPGGWVVRVQDVTGDPRDPAPAAAAASLVALARGGLATSSTSARRWRHAGSVVHHILDPRTGMPAADVWRTVSVAAPTCVEANVASTTAVVRGLGGIGWLRGLGLPARLVANPRRHPASSAVREPLLLGGWPVEKERVA